MSHKTAASGLIARTLASLRTLLDNIDARYMGQPAVSDLRVVLSMVITATVLILLNYVAMDRKIQTETAWFFIKAFDLFDYSSKDGIAPEQLALGQRCAWVAFCILFYLGIPLIANKLIFKRRLSDLGLNGKGFLKHLWIYVLLFIPVGISVAVVSYNPGFQATYPFFRNPYSLWSLIIWELFYGLQFFALEVFFRGFILTEARYKFGWRAVMYMVVPYVMIHFGKPLPETIGSLVAGSVLGILALATGSIWGGVAIHVAVAWSMDIASLAQRGILQRLL